MVEGYVLIQVSPGVTRTVSEEIAAMNGIIWSHDVVGPYDIIARATAESLDELARLVVSKIHACEGVTRTLVCAVPQPQRM